MYAENREFLNTVEIEKYMDGNPVKSNFIYLN